VQACVVEIAIVITTVNVKIITITVVITIAVVTVHARFIDLFLDELTRITIIVYNHRTLEVKSPSLEGFINDENHFAFLYVQINYNMNNMTQCIFSGHLSKSNADQY